MSTQAIVASNNGLKSIYQELSELETSRRLVITAQELEELEQEIRELTNRLAACLLGQKVQESLDAEEMATSEKAFIRHHPKRLKSDGKREVSVRTSYGPSIVVNARYYRRNCDKRGRKRNKGVYAGLVLLGVFEHCTPSLTSEISQMVALLGSFAEAAHVLAERGLVLGAKSLRLIAYRAVDRARLVQQSVGYLGTIDASAKGRRVVVSCDGGRLRLREKKRGRKTPKGRSHYTGAWREPKLFIIYVVDENGQQAAEFAPLIDGTLNGPDTLFAMLTSYLQALAIDGADQLLLISDGAKWIWNRWPKLIDTLNLKPQNVFLLIDFYHAVEHLGKVAALCKAWTPSARKRWLTTQRRLLRAGKVDEVIQNIKPLCKGRLSRSIRTQLNYFVNHQAHMNYALSDTHKLPIGSGAIESTIRRVVNLRLKGSAIFWCKKNAQAMIFIRACAKSGRWDLFKSLAFSPAYAYSL